MRVFWLGMWFAIAMLASGPVGRLTADDKAEKSTATSKAEKASDGKADDDGSDSDSQSSALSKAKAEAEEAKERAKLAEKKAAEAIEQRKLAEESRAKAEKAKDEAVKARAEAEAAKKELAKLKAEKARAEKEASKSEAEQSSKDKKAEEKKVRFAHIRIEGSLPESPGEMSLFGDLGVDLRKTMARLEKAGEDESVAAVILEIDAEVGHGKLNELRAAVDRVQTHGKKVYAVLESATGTQYLLAAACDEIVLPESGEVLLPGVRAEFSFYKDLLGKLGIEADMLHVGQYKGAAESYTRTSLSEPVRKNMTALVDDLYDEMIATVASDRNIKAEQVRELVDVGMISATRAKEEGLIDRVAYPDELRAELAKEYKADKLVYVENYAKQKVDADFSGPMGMMKLFQSVMNAESGKSGSGDAKIAVVYAVGPIMSGESQSSLFGEKVMGSTTIVEALKEAGKDENVKAIVLRVDSPGGSALASDLIWRQTQAIEKPIVASMGDVAASGGYYISMGADRIFAEPGTVTGSIGVVGGKMAMKGLYDKIGISTESIARGNNSGIFSSTAKFTKSEREVVERMMNDVYKQFTAKAAKGRDMEPEELEKLAGGQVYTGRTAQRIGLVDEIGTLRDAIQSAKRLAGLNPNKKVEVQVLPKPENPFESLFGADMDAEREAEANVLAAVRSFAPELAGPLRHAALLRQVLREPVALMMPYWLEIK
jgi:protease-4